MRRLQTFLESLLLLTLAYNTEAFTVCVISLAPGFTDCDPATDPASWTGYDLDNWRWVAKEMRWEEGGSEYATASVESGNYTFSCQPSVWGGMMLRLVNDSQYQDCHVALGLISITSQRLEMGVQFSARNFHGSVSVMVRSEHSTFYSAWGFLRPFRWTLWLAFLLTLLALPLLLWLIETTATSGCVVPVGWSTLDDLQSALFLTGLTVFNLRTFPATQLPTQVVVIAWCALVLVLVSNYTASLVAWLSTAITVETISSLAQLAGLAVMATPVYVPNLVAAGLLQVQPNPIVGAARFQYVHDQLTSGAIAAYVADTSVLEFIQKTYDPQCLFKIIKEQFLPVGYGWAYHRLFPADVIDLVDEQLYLAQQNGILGKLESVYIYSKDVCVATDTRIKKSVTFDQLRGLWIILGTVIGLVALWSAGTMWRHVRHHMRQLREQDQEASSDGGDSKAPVGSPPLLSGEEVSPRATPLSPCTLSPISPISPLSTSPASSRPTSPTSPTSLRLPTLSSPPLHFDLDGVPSPGPSPSFRGASRSGERGSRLHTLKRAMSRIFVTVPVFDSAGGNGGGSHHNARASSGRPHSPFGNGGSSSPRLSIGHSPFASSSSPRPCLGPSFFSNSSPRHHMFDDGMPVLLPPRFSAALRSRTESGTCSDLPLRPSSPLFAGGGGGGGGGFPRSGSPNVSMTRQWSDDAAIMPWTFMSEDCSYHPVRRTDDASQPPPSACPSGSAGFRDTPGTHPPPQHTSSTPLRGLSFTGVRPDMSAAPAAPPLTPPLGASPRQGFSTLSAPLWGGAPPAPPPRASVRKPRPLKRVASLPQGLFGTVSADSHLNFVNQWPSSPNRATHAQAASHALLRGGGASGDFSVSPSADRDMLRPPSPWGGEH